MLARTLSLSITASLCLCAVTANGHHSFAAEFIRELITIEGVVVEVWFKNPHVRYYVEVTNDDGETETWDARGGSATNLMRNGGWMQDTINVGDEVVITGNRGRDGRKLIDIRRLDLPDGTVLPRGGAEYRHRR